LTTSANDSSASPEGIFLKALAGGDRLEDAGAQLASSAGRLKIAAGNKKILDPARIGTG